VSAPRVVILDNYDSFVFNLYQAVGEIVGAAPIVFRNDAVDVSALEAIAPTHVIISPGPGDPSHTRCFGACREAILRMGPRVPLLGVCLGHQGIVSSFGGEIVRGSPTHGKTSLVVHDREGLFRDVEFPMRAMRYHSLVVCPDRLPEDLVVTAVTPHGVVMGVRHREYPIHGVQFHPESIGTPDGRRLITNFLEMNSDAG
jgi:anthranilate synthase component 2